jgi:hypothetical protein
MHIHHSELTYNCFQISGFLLGQEITAFRTISPETLFRCENSMYHFFVVSPPRSCSLGKIKNFFLRIFLKFFRK